MGFLWFSKNTSSILTSYRGTNKDQGTELWIRAFCDISKSFNAFIKSWDKVFELFLYFYIHWNVNALGNENSRDINTAIWWEKFSPMGGTNRKTLHDIDSQICKIFKVCYTKFDQHYLFVTETNRVYDVLFFFLKSGLEAHFVSLNSCPFVPDNLISWWPTTMLLGGL